MQELFKKYLNNQCSPEEVKSLLKEFDAGTNEDFLKSLIRQQLEAEQELNSINENELEHILEETYSDIKKEINTGKKSETVPVKSILKKRWYRLAAAAVLILVATGTYLLVNKTGKQQQIVGQQQPANDIAPGDNKAVLTLADGSSIILDKAANGTLTQQGKAKILKLNDGQLAYNTLKDPLTSLSTAEVLYNTITTPRGGQYQLVLSDGSKVWLNAASSLRFPAAFAGKERKVELTGEGYFEVAKNASMPFKVDIAGKGEVEVLGTHFNINAYVDEATINTTLLEGKVKVMSSVSSELLYPGQQAQLNSNGQISLNENVNAEEVVAWKNGKFVFENADIKSIMRQLERWYDVDVTFNGNITTEEFVGIISRNVNVSQILKMLEKTGTVRFEIEGKRILVK